MRRSSMWFALSASALVLGACATEAEDLGHESPSPVHDGLPTEATPDASTTTDGEPPAMAPCTPPAPVPDPASVVTYRAGWADYEAGEFTIPNALSLPGAAPYTVRRSGRVYYPAAEEGMNTPVAGSAKHPVVFLIAGHHAVYRAGGKALDCDRTPNTPVAKYLKQHPGTTEVPNHLGYAYLAKNLAAAGYVVVSINPNDLHCKPEDPMIKQRAQLIVETIKLMQRVEGGTEPALGSLGKALEGRIDFGAVVLIGHSRGGEAVAQAGATYDVAGTTLKGVMAIAPTGFLLPNLKLENVPLLVVVPSADGDVTYGTGSQIYDLASSDGTAPGWFKAQQYLFGGNHNFFNAEWTDALPTSSVGDNGVGNGDHRLTAEQARAYANTITRAFLGATVEGARAMRSVLTGLTPIADDHGVEVWPSYTDSGTDVTPSETPASTGFASFDAYAFNRGRTNTFNDTFFHDTRGFVGVWERAAAEFSFGFTAGPAKPQWVSLRVAQVVDGHNPVSRTMAIDVELEDETGRTARVGSDWAAARIPPYYPRPADKSGTLEKTMLGTVRIPASCFTQQGGLSLDALTRLRVMVRETRGALAFTDFQLIP